MTISYRYLGTEITRTIPKPIVPVVFVNSSTGSLISEGTLIDSGADYTTISEILARRLALPLDGEITKMRGVGSIDKAVRTTGEIILVRHSEAYRITIPIHVKLDSGGPALPYPLLGREGVFEHFDITFRQRKETIDLVNRSGLKRIDVPDKLLPPSKRKGR